MLMVIPSASGRQLDVFAAKEDEEWVVAEKEVEEKTDLSSTNVWAE